MAIEVLTRTVYRAPRAGRCYFSLTAACAAEARAIIKAKYPAEQAEYDQGYMTYPGHTWHDIARSDVLYRRLTRLIRAAYNNQKSETEPCRPIE